MIDTDLVALLLSQVAIGGAKAEQITGVGGVGSCFNWLSTFIMSSCHHVIIIDRRCCIA